MEKENDSQRPNTIKNSQCELHKLGLQMKREERKPQLDTKSVQ
jgi:hypothetical protein